MNQTVRVAKLKMTTAMFIFGTIVIFVPMIPLPSSVISLSRAIVGFIFLTTVLCARNVSFSLTAVRKNFRWLILSGLFLGFNWMLLFESYRYTSAAVSTLCYYMAPILVISVSPLVLGEPLTLRKGLCVLTALFGIVCISGVLQTGIPEAKELKGILLGLAAAVLYAAIVLTNKQIRDVSAYEKTIVQLGISAIVLTPYCFITEDMTALEFSPSTILLLLLVGIVHTGISYYLYFGSFKYIPGQTVAIISYIDPVVAVLSSVLILRQPMQLTDGIGALLILGAAFFSEINFTRNAPRNVPATEVVAALIWDGDRFLACQRPAHKARGLMWEFVGGKVESGETKEMALIRECREELGITLSVGDIFTELTHEYPDLTVHLTLFNATIAQGSPQKIEHNDILWITPEEAINYPFCPADDPILERLMQK